jgi:hypothetical protein
MREFQGNPAMIQMPRRSVTRFFIPLIDVMILLFCIFLLMPLFKEGAEDAKEGAAPPSAAELARAEKAAQRYKQKLKLRERELAATRQELDVLQQQAKPLTVWERKRLEALAREKGTPLQDRVLVRVLDIDPKTGELFYYGPGRDKNPIIDSEEKAQRLIERLKKNAEAGKRELYVLFLFPRNSGYPEDAQFEQYERWFKNVPHGTSQAEGQPMPGEKP